MNIQEREEDIKVRIEDKEVCYNREDWNEDANYLTSDGLIKMKEWKIDLVKNHGVDLDDL